MMDLNGWRSAIELGNKMNGNFTVLSNEDAELFRKLKVLFNEARSLSINANSLEGYSVIYQIDLERALERVKENWWFDEI